jgi:hypothetical protein
MAKAPPKLSRQQALAVIREFAKDSMDVFAVGHAMQRLKQHRFTRRQMMTCLQRGIITEGPALNSRGHWQVNVTRMAAGEEMTCVVVIEWDQRLVVRTVF